MQGKKGAGLVGALLPYRSTCNLSISRKIEEDHTTLSYVFIKSKVSKH